LPFESVLDFRVELNEDHELFRKSVRQFVERYLEPRVKEIEQRNEIPKELYEKAAEAGFMGLGIPEEYGGQGSDYLNVVIFTEEVSRVCPAFVTSTLVGGLFTTPVLIFGTEEQKRKYIPPLARGEKFAAHATTEPGAGSDVAGIKTRASGRTEAGSSQAKSTSSRVRTRPITSSSSQGPATLPAGTRGTRASRCSSWSATRLDSG